MKLVVMSGLPGTGKSTIAESIAIQHQFPIFAKDWIEASLRQSGVSSPLAGYASYDLLTTLAHSQLRLGQSVILDSVASPPKIRATWRDLARSFDAEFIVILCVCSDKVQHRSQIAQRQRNIPGWHELTWADVERVAANFHLWEDDHLTLDASNPIKQNVELALNQINQF